MGTNFFIILPLSLDEKRELIDDIVCDRYFSISDKLPKDIHIGKKSAGWKFLWNANKFKYFKPNKESILNFLKSGQIYDEGGNFYTYDEFIIDAIGSSIDVGYDGETYEKEKGDCSFSQHYRYLLMQEKFMIEEFKLKVNNQGEFYIDNFRFTISDDFS